MPRQNRVDPWGDLTAVVARGMFTGNRGCLVDDSGRLVRHHRGSLWITCLTHYREWRHPLAAPNTWTPLFFLDDAVALAAGHRPCGLCRRADYLSYREAVTRAIDADPPLRAPALNRRLGYERLRRGRGLDRAADRILWEGPMDDLPSGTVVVNPDDDAPYLVTAHSLQAFSHAGWEAPSPRPGGVFAIVLTPPTSVAALANGFSPRLHPTAAAGSPGGS